MLAVSRIPLARSFYVKQFNTVIRSNDIIGPVKLFAFLSASMALVYSFYSAALNAPFFFDDYPTFRGLGEVRDIQSAWVYIWSGVASAVGRPLANLSFLLNAPDWQGNPGGFRRIGTLLHLLNGLLLAWLAFRCARLLPALKAHGITFAVLLSACWLMHPLFFSANLMPVQRMTVLSATFVLIGLLIYVVGKEVAQKDWRKGLAISSAGIIFGAGAGVLAKENAALLPLFVAVCETTLFRGEKNAVPARLLLAWRCAFLALPILLLCAYVAHKWPTFELNYRAREFTLSERLATESIILWDYAKLILAPDITRYSPFHDDYPVFSFTSWKAIFALVAWCLAVTVGVLLLRTRANPYHLFAVLWFLAGHLLESTVIPLELYFEHRNYVAAIGPLALVVGLCCYSSKIRYLPWCFLLLLAFSLWRVTSLWSEPLLAAKTMVKYHPESQRANQLLAILYDERGDRASAFKIVNEMADKFPHSSAMQAARLQLSCSFSEPVVRMSYAKILAQARSMNSNYAMADSFYVVAERVKENRCHGLNADELLQLLDKLIQNPRVIANPSLMHHLHHVKSLIFMQLEHYPKSIAELVSAHQYMQNPETVMMIAGLILRQGGAEIALSFLDTEIGKIESRMLRRRDNWRLEVAKLRAQICLNLAHGCRQ